MMRQLKYLTEGRRFYPAAILLIVLFTGMRLVHINADAPQDLSISAASYTDEGFKTYEPRNKALFGDWKWTPEDEYEGWTKTSPLTVNLYAWIFKHFGVSYASIRSLSVLYGAITMIFLFLFLARNFDRVTALIGLILFGTNFFTAMYNRLGLYEPHLVCFLMISLYGFSEFILTYRSAPGTAAGKGSRAATIITRTAFLLLGLLGLAAGFFVKRNLLLVLPAVAPGLLLLISNRIGKSEKFMNRLLILLLGSFLLFYLLFAHLGIFKIKLAFFLLSYRAFGQALISLIPFTAFDPAHLVLGKILYMEFIFLHPFTFSAALLYSIYTFYNYIFRKRQSGLDLLLSSWFIFGFIFTTVMYYSPSRYYLLMVIPMIVLTARCIAGFSPDGIGAFIAGKKKFPYNAVFFLFLLLAVLDTGVIAIVQAVPASMRNRLVDILYPAFVNKEYARALPIAAPVLAVAAVLSLLPILFRRRLREALSRPNFHIILFSLILALQLFQYGKWFFFHDHALYETSRELGRELPARSIIAGSWSAGLVVENGLRPLIMQSLIPYNHNLIKKLLYDIDIPVHEISGGATVTRRESGFPLYIAVCRNVIFERAIAEIYKDHFKPENLVKKARFGFFQIEIFKMNKYKVEPDNAVDSLFRSFL